MIESLKVASILGLVVFGVVSVASLARYWLADSDPHPKATLAAGMLQAFTAGMVVFGVLMGVRLGTHFLRGSLGFALGGLLGLIGGLIVGVGGGSFAAERMTRRLGAE